MQRTKFGFVCFLVLFTLGLVTTRSFGQPTAFSYQGSLNDTSGLADGLYDFQFMVYSSMSGGTSLGSNERLGVQVLGGVFTVELDFGLGVFLEPSSQRYLEIAVRVEGDPSYTTLNPRVAINSAPYAIHADTADYALDGPFAPVDTTPISTSGTGPAGAQNIIPLLRLNGQDFNNVQVQFPITISRQVISHNDIFLTPGKYDDFSIDVSRPLDAHFPWSNYYQQTATNVLLQITIVNFTPGDQTTFIFQNGTVTGYHLDQDGANGVREVLTITFGAVAAPSQLPLGSLVIRDASGFTGTGIHPPFSPYLGGSAVLPGVYTYSFGGFTPPHSSVGVLPYESRPTFGGIPNGRSQAQPLVMLCNVFADAPNTMWDEFATPGNPQPIELRDASGIIWLPPLAPNSSAVINSWTLDQADDGGLYEAYELQYLADPFAP